MLELAEATFAVMTHAPAARRFQMVITTRPAPKLSDELLEAIEHGVLTDDQLKELITCEAELLGLSFDQAVEAARQNRLPKTPIGYDIRHLVRMLAD